MKFTRERNKRGFIINHFEDDYGEKCSLQQSSSLDPHIWLGIAYANPMIMCSDAQKLGLPMKANNGWQEFEIPEEVFINTRMHLTKRQARKLAMKLLKFGLFGKV